VGFLKGDFDNVELIEHWESNSNNLCPYCSCFCSNPINPNDRSCIPATLTLELVPHPDNAYACAPMDNATFTLTQGYVYDVDANDEPVIWPLAWKESWFSNTFHPECEVYDPDTDPPCEKIFFELRCGGELNFSLWIWTATGGSYIEAQVLNFDDDWIDPYTHAKDQNATAGSCDPLYIVFENIITALDDCNYEGDPTGVKYGACPTCYPPGTDLPTLLWNGVVY